MDDRLLVELLIAADPRGLAGVYDAYADRLYSYCTTMLRDREAAADAVHDTLLVARERVGQLRDPDRLRPWLYAIARNECLRTLRDRRRNTGLDEAGDVTDESADLEAGLRAQEMRELVWAAAESLNPREREVLELSVRHGLDGADLAAALGVSTNHAHALVSRARTQLERALVVLVVARTGRQACAELDGMLTGWDGRLTALLRKRLGRHIERCDICGEERRRRVSAAALLAGVPFVIAPPALRDRVLSDAANLDLVSSWETLANRSGPFRGDGFPRPYDLHRRRVMTGVSAAAVAVLTLIVILAAVVLPGPTPGPVAGNAAALGGPGQNAAGGPGSTDPNAAPGDSGTATGTASPTGSPTATETPPVAGPPSTVPGADPLPPTIPPPGGPGSTGSTGGSPPGGPTNLPTTTATSRPPEGITTSDSVNESQCPEVWTGDLFATVTGIDPASVTAVLTEAGKTRNVPMTLQNGRWVATTGRESGRSTVTWFATTSRVVGRAPLQSASRTIGPCPQPIPTTTSPPPPG